MVSRHLEELLSNKPSPFATQGCPRTHPCAPHVVCWSIYICQGQNLGDILVCHHEAVSAITIFCQPPLGTFSQEIKAESTVAARGSWPVLQMKTVVLSLSSSPYNWNNMCRSFSNKMTLDSSSHVLFDTVPKNEEEERTCLPDGCQLPQDASQPQVLVSITPTHSASWAGLRFNTLFIFSHAFKKGEKKKSWNLCSFLKPLRKRKLRSKQTVARATALLPAEGFSQPKRCLCLSSSPCPGTTVIELA